MFLLLLFLKYHHCFGDIFYDLAVTFSQVKPIGLFFPPGPLGQMAQTGGFWCTHQGGLAWVRYFPHKLWVLYLEFKETQYMFEV